LFIHTPRDFAVLSLLSILLLSTVAFIQPTPSNRSVEPEVPPLAPPMAPMATDSHISDIDGPEFIWPVSGGITSYFDSSHRLGIDISLSANLNGPIKAAAAGEVVLAGGTRCCGYGLYIIIDHGGGVTTRYGHLETLAVAEGDEVAQGQVIGSGGNTGTSSAHHLHFEIRRNNEPTDPMALLPSTCKEVPGRYREMATDVPGGCVPGALDALITDPESLLR